ncbi:MAG: trimethylamine methyltransferase family protein, partial [Nitrospinota bacterium]
MDGGAHRVGGTLRFLSDEGVQKIHGASLSLLEETGLRVMHERALRLLADAGARVDFEKELVRFPAPLVEKCLESIPRRFVYGGRTLENDLLVEIGGEFHTRPLTGAERYIDLETDEFRDVRTSDLIEWTRLCDALEHVDYCASIFPQDMAPVDVRDVLVVRTMMEHTRKHIEVQAFTGAGVELMGRMCVAVLGSREEAKRRPLLSVLTSATAPLQYIGHTVDIMFAAGEYGIPIELNDIPIAGGTAPVTLAGLLLMHNCDVLAGVVISQVAYPGTPILSTPRPTVMDMRTGAGLEGLVENAMLSAALGQMAREAYRMPANLFGPSTDSLISDGQSQIERVFNALLPALAGSNVIAGMGNLEHCYALSPVQLVIDDEIIGMVRRALKGIEVNDETLALDAIREIGPG